MNLKQYLFLKDVDIMDVYTQHFLEGKNRIRLKGRTINLQGRGVIASTLREFLEKMQKQIEKEGIIILP